MRTSAVKQPRPRFTALDQVRGFAILAMIFAHFGPGLYERLGVTGPMLDILHLFGRFATPAFVLIFGLTLAIVYIPKARVDPRAVRIKLMNRAATVFFFSLVICIPGTIALLAGRGGGPSEVTAFSLISSQYSVLTFYAVAMVVTAAMIRFFAQDSALRGVLLGSLSVFLGTYLAYDVWPSRPETMMEILRILFVSGKYGVLVLMGCAWIMLAVGMYINKCLADGVPFRRNVLVIGMTAILLGLSDGRIVGWRTISDLSLQFHAPPQFWYFSIVAGASLISLVALDKFRIPVLGAVMAQVGRYPMSIYVAHAFVLPGISALRYLVPGIPDAVSVTVCLGLFLAFCAYKIGPALIESARDGAGRTPSDGVRAAS